MDDNSDDEEIEPEVHEERFIVEKSAFMEMFKVCNTLGCGAMIDPDDVQLKKIGGAVKVTGTCLNNHKNIFKSSRSTHEGNKEIFVINILLAAYTLFCGLNFSHVS